MSRSIGKYQIEAVVAKGPQGTVYRATAGPDGASVAVKLIPSSIIEPRTLPPYRKYAQALARLKHPGIARFIELVEIDNAVCLVSEFVEGRPLSELLKNGAHPDPRHAWSFVRQLLEALAFAHGRGAVHRDLKPSNLMIGRQGHLKITDFATATLRSGPADPPHYRAPEQFCDGDVTARTDIYQVGAIVYQLLTGKLPFSGTYDEVAHCVLQERPSDPSSYDNHIAWQLDWVIQKALSKDPADRFASAAEFGEGLRLGLQDTTWRPLEPMDAPHEGKAAAAAPAGRVEQAQATPAPAPAAKAAKPPAAKPATPAQPVAATATQPETTPVASAEDAKKVRVLFVDDDERIVNGLRTVFRQDYHVFTAPNGALALELVKRFRIQVVVSDQRMPGITGVELLRQVRAVEPLAVRILLTGYSDLAALAGSINQGEIFRFVRKPWDNDELRRTLADAAKIATELAGSPLPGPGSPRSAGSLLVIQRGDSLARGLERLLAGAARVHRAASVRDAVKVLEKEDIAAVVADLGAGRDGLVSLFKVLKARRPEILSILVTDEPDSDLVVELINKAQIFRFLAKPVSGRELRAHVAAALRRYAAFKQVPTLVNQVRPEAGPQTEAELKLAERMRAHAERAIAGPA